MKTNMTRKQAANELRNMTRAVLLPDGTPVSMDRVTSLLSHPWARAIRQNDGSIYVEGSRDSFQVMK